MQENHSKILSKTTVKKHLEIPLQNLNKSYENTTKNEELLLENINGYCI